MLHLLFEKADDYISDTKARYESRIKEISRLDMQKKDMHQSLMKEQARAAKSRSKGEKSVSQRKWPTITSRCKALNAEKTSGRKKSAIANQKQALIDQLEESRLPEVITAKFSLDAVDLGERCIVSIMDGYVAYKDKEPILENINLNLGAKDRIAIAGDNASGKSTLIKAILDNHAIVRSGDWYAPLNQDIGCLDQHYNSLNHIDTVLETISELVPSWNHADIRRHLNDFLFRKNEEVNSLVSNLSGGERVRLILAKIAAKPPKLLILDEISNNLDIETLQHVIQVIKDYPGAMIVISHDEYFIEEIGINDIYEIKSKQLRLSNN